MGSLFWIVGLIVAFLLGAFVMNVVCWVATRRVEISKIDVMDSIRKKVEEDRAQRLFGEKEREMFNRNLRRWG